MFVCLISNLKSQSIDVAFILWYFYPPLQLHGILNVLPYMYGWFGLNTFQTLHDLSRPLSAEILSMEDRVDVKSWLGQVKIF